MRIESILALESNATRLAFIIRILAKYGLADWLSGLDYKWLQEKFKSFDGQRLKDLKTPERIRLALIELGSTYIKLGQILSTRPDLIGPELAAELSKLQSQTVSDSPDLIRQVFVEEFGRPPEEVFREFDPEPLASASIAQVHRAVLPTGEEVAVKVQHADLAPWINSDLDILHGLAELAEKHSSVLRLYQPVATARQFARVLRRELDFTNERRNLEQFARNFEFDDTVEFPAVHTDYCTRRILTMERLHGLPVTDLEGLRKSGRDLNEFARRGAIMYLNMIFRDGFYHADPHPGNVMMLEENVVGVLDCGMVGRLDENLKEQVEDLLLAAVEQDPGRLCDTVLRSGAAPPDCNRDELRGDLADLLHDYVGQSLKEFDLSGALNGLAGVICRHHIVLPAPLSMLIKVLVMLEGTSHRLDPSFSLVDLMQPFYARTVRQRVAPRRFWRRLNKAARDWARFLDNLPRDLSDIVTRVRSGTFHVHLEHRRIESAANRLVVGILTAALFLGSSLLWSRQAPPLIWGISVFGVGGYMASVWLGFRLLFAVRKTGNIRNKSD